MAGSRLVMEGVCKRFGATRALDDVSLEVAPGEVLGLIGENGAGKSTLMQILSGAVRADAGQMWLDGERYQPRSPGEGRARGVSMIYQELSLAPHLSVAENVLLGNEPTRGPWLRRAELRRRAQLALQQLGREDLGLDRPAGELSVAEQQVVEIARSVASRSRVLVLDEPTSSLTRADVRRLFAAIRRRRAEGTAVLYISHVLEEVQEIADRFTVLRDGASVASGALEGVALSTLVEHMVGRTVENLYPRSPRVPGERILELRGVSGLQRPEDASLDVRRGEVVGIAGLVGAGRTELLRAVFGLDGVRAGTIRVAAFEGAATPGQRWRQGVGMVPEDRKAEGLSLSLSIAENLTLPRLQGLGPGCLVLPRAQEQASAQLIESMDIRCLSPRQAVRDLSGGNQQKVALARLLHADVDLLLLDEPTRGIDVGSKAQIYRWMDERVRGEGRRGSGSRAILLVSSHLPELLGTCDRIAVMCRGRLGPARPVAAWSERELMEEATATRAATRAAGRA